MKIFESLKKADATSRSAVKNFLIRPIGMVLAAVYTPLLLDYLGNEANGVWVTILSVINWIQYCDLGIGNGLRNLLAKELAADNFEEAQKSISTAYVVLTGISLLILIFLLILSYLVNWNEILKTKLVVRPMIIITFAFICLNFILSLSNSVLYAMQLSERVSIRSCFVQVLNIIGLLFLRSVESGNLTHMAILFGSTSSIIYVANTIGIFRKNGSLIPKISGFQKEKISQITKFGLQFFIIQLTAILIFSSHNMIGSYLFGAEAVTPMNTVSTVYAAGYSFMAALVLPYWSRTTEAIEKGEFNWIRSSMRKVRYISLVFFIGFVAAALVFKDISRIWLGKELDYPAGMIAATCAFYCMELLNLIFVQFYYGIGEVKDYMILTIIQAALVIPLSYFLSITCNIGIVGVKLAGTILLAVSGLLLPFMTYGKINQLETRFSMNKIVKT